MWMASIQTSFEAMLEVVVSIAVRLDGEGIPLGFVTNGAFSRRWLRDPSHRQGLHPGHLRSAG